MNTNNAIPCKHNWQQCWQCEEESKQLLEKQTMRYLLKYSLKFENHITHNDEFHNKELLKALIARIKHSAYEIYAWEFDETTTLETYRPIYKYDSSTYTEASSL